MSYHKWLYWTTIDQLASRKSLYLLNSFDVYATATLLTFPMRIKSVIHKSRTLQLSVTALKVLYSCISSLYMQTVPSYKWSIVERKRTLHFVVSYFTDRDIPTKTFHMLNTFDWISMSTDRRKIRRWITKICNYLRRLLTFFQFGTDDARSRSSLSYNFNIK